MSKIWAIPTPTGVDLVTLGPNCFPSRMTQAEWEEWALAKTCFERTRPRTPAGRNEHFDFADPAHRGRAASIVRFQMDTSDLPADRTQRARWRRVNGRVVVVS